MALPIASIFAGVRKRAKGWLTATDRLLLPPRCAYCREDFFPADDGLGLCLECQRTLIPPPGPLCRQCGASVPLPQSSANICPVCPHCAEHDWHFDTVVPLGRYRDSLRDAVLRMKHAAEEPLTRALGRLLFLQHEQELTAIKADVIVPIPMHWTRRMARGVNNPDVLAAQLSHGLSVRCHPSVLRRVRRTEKHGYISRAKRYENIHGAFAASSAYALAGARILLVDDILTTGVTCNEAARILRSAGAASISVAVIARAEGEH